jgi:nicotinate-nucleotide--dimethylbenzimidazole phosphoribosyltransferase
MDLFETIFKRRDTRHFLNENVPREILDKAFKAAHHGPSVGLSQPTKYYLIEELSIRKEIKNLFEKADRKAKKNILDLEQKVAYENLKLQAIIDAPIGMIVTTDYTVLNDFTIGVVGNAHALQWSSVCAIQNFWLSLTEDGYSLGWVSILDYNGLNELLQIPNHEIALGYFCIGKPASDYGGKPMLETFNWKKAKQQPTVIKISQLKQKVKNSLTEAKPENLLENNTEFWENEALKIWDKKMIPSKSLGTLERMCIKLCGIQKTAQPSVKKTTVLLFAADHGIAQTGLVNKYPQGMTLQLINNQLNGSGALSILCKENNLLVKIIDCGINGVIQKDLKNEDFIDVSISTGTRNFLEEQAMTISQYEKCIENGKQIVRNLKDNDLFIFGEIGIGNTSSSSLLLASILNIPLEICIGKGAGHSDEGLLQKRETLKTVFEKHNPTTIQQKVCCFGGFEIATMIGAFLKANELQIPVLVDGFISGVALLCASEINPNVINNCLFSHLGKEKAHELLLKHFKADVFLKLQLALGEGSGACFAYPLLKNTVALFNQLEEF